MQATAIVPRNSLAYIAQVFSSSDARRTLVGVLDARHTTELRGISIDTCIEPAMQYGWYSTKHDLITDDLPAQITFTSGTEGRPKAVVLSYANLADAAGRIIQAMGMTSEIREYVGVPVTHSFGMGRIRAICAVGGSAYVPQGFDPMELARMLAAGEVNALSAVPTLLRILLEVPEVIGTAGAKLRWLEIGSQYMSASEKRRVRELFPNARIIQHYGLTEASRSTFLNVTTATDEQLESVGKPEGGVEIGIDQGRIRIRGPNVARWRVDADGLHALCDAEGWLQSNDLGHMHDGYLCFDGRADDLINCGGVKIVPDVLEEKIRALLPAGARIAVTKVKDEVRGEAVLAVIEGKTEALPRLKEVAVAAMNELGVAAAGSLQVWSVATIPTTATGKPRRRELTAEFEAMQSDAVVNADQQPGKRESRTVRDVFERVFPAATVGADDTFASLGGDSLRYIQFSMQFERQFGRLPNQWQSLSVSQLQERAASSVRSSWCSLEPSMLLRAMAIFVIVARHTHPFIYSRNYSAGVLLFALGGYALARFQLPEIIRKGNARRVLGTALMIAIPTILVAIPSQAKNHVFEPLQYLMIMNHFNPAAPSRINMVSFYFAEIYFQMLLLAALIFSFPRIRALFRDHAVPSAIGLVAAAVGFKILVDAVWDTHYLYQRLPNNYFWYFCLGILVAVCKTLPQRLFATLVAVTGSYILWGFETSFFFFAGGITMMAFIPSIRVPSLIKTVIGGIAAASMFTYLIHFQVRDSVTKVFGHEMPWTATFVVFVAGIAFAYFYAYAQRLLGHTKFGHRVYGWFNG